MVNRTHPTTARFYRTSNCSRQKKRHLLESLTEDPIRRAVNTYTFIYMYVDRRIHRLSFLLNFELYACIWQRGVWRLY